MHARRAARDEADADANAVVPFLRERLGTRRTDRDPRICIRSASASRRSTIASAISFALAKTRRSRCSRTTFAPTSRSWPRAPRAEHSRSDLIAPLEHEIERRLAGSVFGIDDETPASAILRALRARRGAPGAGRILHRRTHRGGADERPGSLGELQSARRCVRQRRKDRRAWRRGGDARTLRRGQRRDRRARWRAGARSRLGAGSGALRRPALPARAAVRRRNRSGCVVRARRRAARRRALARFMSTAIATRSCGARRRLR